MESNPSEFWPSRSPLWKVIAAAWDRVCSAPGVSHLLDIDRPDLAVRMAALPGHADTSLLDEDDTGRVLLLALGSGMSLNEELRRRVDILPRPSWAMMPANAVGDLDGVVRFWLGHELDASWDFYWTQEPLPWPGEAELLDPTEAADLIPAFLAIANPTSSAAHHVEDFRWWVIRDSEGAIGAAAGAADDLSFDSLGVVNLSGVGCRPDMRRMGLTRRLIAGAVAGELASRDLVHLSMWSDNTAARALYESLGFRHAGPMRIVRYAPVIRGHHPPVQPD